MVLAYELARTMKPESVQLCALPRLSDHRLPMFLMEGLYSKGLEAAGMQAQCMQGRGV